MTDVEKYISHRLESICRDFGLSEIYYCYDLASPDSWKNRGKGKRRFYECSQKNRLTYFSSGSFALSWPELARRACRGGCERLLEMDRHSVYFWPNANPDVAKVRRQLQVDGLVTVSIPCRVSESYAGRFTILFGGDFPERESLEASGELYRVLLELQMDISLNFAQRLNPLVGYNIVNPVSVYLLGLLTSGYERKEASSKMRLTMRGIDYHLATLKSSLGAKNMPQLVKLASYYRLV